MKIEQFEDYIHDDLAWRKMEISQLFRIFNVNVKPRALDN